MKKPRMVPAYYNMLTFNERRHMLHMTLAFFVTGMYTVVIWLEAIPRILANKFSFLDWQFYLYSVIIIFVAIEWVQVAKYKKLIKLEPKALQTKGEQG